MPSINIDNSMKCDKQDNLDFSGYSTNIKAIILYNPKNKLLTENDNTIKELEEQINLAKNHGIYGFGFYHFWPSVKTNLN